MLIKWWTGLCKELIPPSYLNSIYNILFKKIVLFLCYEHGSLVRKGVFCAEASMEQQHPLLFLRRGPQVWGFRLMGQLSDGSLTLSALRHYCQYQFLDVPVILCISFCKDTSQMPFLQGMYVYALEFEDILGGLCLQLSIIIPLF